MAPQEEHGTISGAEPPERPFSIAPDRSFIDMASLFRMLFLSRTTAKAYTPFKVTGSSYVFPERVLRAPLAEFFFHTISSNPLSMHPLIDFLNHGDLPFTGRGEELQRLLSFWASTPESNGLRSVLLVGEAGIGKSRLVEELIPRIHRAGGLVIRTKLLPEAASSIVPLIARALWYSEGGRHLLKKEPEETLGSVVAALRRLARLRPTLLVIEDLHLLGEEAVRELWHLFESLDDETISILCTARPVELAARGILERYLVDRIELHGLESGELEALWEEVFLMAPEGEVVKSLGDATAGNPLAVRSALRGGFASGALAREAHGGSAPIRLDRDRFLSGLRHDMGLLTEGMAAHLTPEEQRWAAALAPLGEAFARETAEAMLDDAGVAIERLKFRGILGDSPTPRNPLAGIDPEIPVYPASSLPLLGFAHTLVHRHFADTAVPDQLRLLNAIGSGLPLYSLLPFRILEEYLRQEDAPLEQVSIALHRSRYVALDLSNSPDWPLAFGIWKVADTLFQRYETRWSPEERDDIAIGLLIVRISLLVPTRSWDEYRELAGRLLALTENPATLSQASNRIAALAKEAALRLDDPAIGRRMWEQGEELIRNFPDLRFKHSYGLFLALVASTSYDHGDIDIVRLVERRMEEILNDERGRRVGKSVQGWVLPCCILAFDSETELRERLEMVAELERGIEGSQQELMMSMAKVMLLDDAGYADELLRAADMALPKFRMHGWEVSCYKSAAARLRTLAGLGMEPGNLEARAERLIAETPEHLRDSCGAFVRAALCEAAILCGDTGRARRLAGAIPADMEQPAGTARSILAPRESPIPDSLLNELEHAATPPLAEGIALLRNCAATEQRRNQREKAASRTVLRTADILSLHAALAILEREPAAESLRTAVLDALPAALEWLEQRRLPAWMAGLLARGGSLLTARNARSWRARASAVARERDAELAALGGDGRIRVSMLGRIALELPDGETQRIQGARLRAVLGLMVANEMLDAPLTHREFCAIATGDDIPERARNVVYVKLHNLRELIGSDGVLTETDDAPRLNPERVQVDLLEAHRALGEVRSAMREGALLRAFPALIRALDHTAGEVPFPGLYEDFFEAAREDFENALRLAAVSVAKGLLREDDPQRAEEALRRPFEMMPDDEQIALLLREALTRRGKRTEAERIRLRAAAEAI